MGGSGWDCSLACHVSPTVSSPTLCADLPLRNKERISFCPPPAGLVSGRGASSWSGRSLLLPRASAAACEEADSDGTCCSLWWEQASGLGFPGFLASSQTGRLALHNPRAGCGFLRSQNGLRNCRTPLSYYTVIPAASLRIY